MWLRLHVQTNFKNAQILLHKFTQIPAGGPPASRSCWHFKPRVPAAAAAARTALFSPSPNAKPPPPSLAGPHSQAKQAGDGGLQASSVLSATLAALRQASTGHAQAVSGSADAEELPASAAAVAGVAEMRRTEQQSNPEFKAAQEAEWQQRQAEIGKQAELAQRLKRQRKAEKEKKIRQEVALLIESLGCFWILPCGNSVTMPRGVQSVFLFKTTTGLCTTTYVLYHVQQHCYCYTVKPDILLLCYKLPFRSSEPILQGSGCLQTYCYHFSSCGSCVAGCSWFIIVPHMYGQCKMQYAVSSS